MITNKKKVEKRGERERKKRRTCAKSGSLVDIKWSKPFLSLHFLLLSVFTLSLLLINNTNTNTNLSSNFKSKSLSHYIPPFLPSSPFLYSQIHCFFSQFPLLLPNTPFSRVRTSFSFPFPIILLNSLSFSLTVFVMSEIRLCLCLFGSKGREY